MKSSFHFFCIVSILVAFLIQGCNISKYIPPKKYLLEKVTIKGSPKEEREELYSLVRQNPNTKILGFYKFNMWYYLLVDTKKKREKWRRKVDKLNTQVAGYEAQLPKTDSTNIKERTRLENKIARTNVEIDNWTNREENRKKTVWEEPVILDSTLLAATNVQIKSYLFNKGYYYDTVNFKVKIRGVKAYVTFNIKPGKASYIHKVDYYIFDKRIADIVANDSAKRLVKPGQKYDGELINAERNRLTLLLRNNGYYNFRRDYIYFEVDTSLSGNLVNVGLGIANPTSRSRHRLYKIGTVFVEPEYIQNEKEIKDTTQYDSLYFISKELRIKPSVLSQYIFIHPNTIYSADDYQSTINRLSQLNTYKFVDIQYTPDTVSKPDTGILNVLIKLTPFPKQAIIYNLELNTVEESQASIATTRSLGAAASVGYVDKNLGGGAMTLQVKPYGSIEVPFSILQHSNAIDTPTYQYGLTTSLIIPRLLVPWHLSEKERKQLAQTSFNLSYIVENNVEFQRNTLSGNMTWQLKLPKNQTLSVTPVEISLVNTGYLSSTFRNSIYDTHNPLLIDLFDQHLVTDGRVSWFVNQQPLTNVKNPYWYVRLSAEIGGNAPAFIDKAFFNQPRPAGAATNQIFGINYYQYSKFEADEQYYLPVFRNDNIAMRLITGIGTPQSLAGILFPNTRSTELPFEKQFYVGGANSIRAWKLRTLGPGSYADHLSQTYFDKSGDIKLEGNIELRFPIYRILKGAIFTDAGNVWLFNNDKNRPGSGFYFNEFYKQIAVGSGLGLRLDFSYFVVRVDFAVPLRDPSRPAGSEWEVDELLHENGWIQRNLQINLGIGFPF